MSPIHESNRRRVSRSVRAQSTRTFLLVLSLFGSVSSSWFFNARSSEAALIQDVDLSNATIIISDRDMAAAERIAPTILTEEVHKRTGLNWPIESIASENIAAKPSSQVKIFLINKSTLPASKNSLLSIPQEVIEKVPNKSEGFCIQVQKLVDQAPRVWIVGSDARGVMFGVGRLLRQLDLKPGLATLEDDYHCTSAPDKPIRGHQIGYRPRANSWDAWTIEQFDQYFRDLVVFGANCMENIPFQDEDPQPLMKYPRQQMNVEFAKLCIKYDLDHWIWVPVEITVASEPEKCEQFLQRQESFYKTCPRLDAIFVPGGDPGHNPSSSLLPYLEKMIASAQNYHPNVKLWLSLQGFKGKDIDDFYDYVETKRPQWLGGVVMGPSSPPMEITRQRLPNQYQLRWYPDITHIVRCQYPIPWLDPAWGITIGREGINPRPQDYAAIYANDYRLTDGFVSYSDGIHDDFNKNLWNLLSWDPKTPVREIAKQYSKYFFRSDLSDVGAAAILGLEANLQGPADTNGSVLGTLALWQQMEKRLPQAGRNWRFDLHLFRAYFDAYTQARLLYEMRLEAQALEILSQVSSIGVESSVSQALEKLKEAETKRVRPELLAKVEQLADHLFQAISFQTSVPKYGATGYERGCMMDYVNYPLNNRWWIEDQLALVRKQESREEQLQSIRKIVDWENPGRGGYYEVLGHVGKSQHVVKLQNAGDVMRRYSEFAIPTQRNIGPMRNGLRQSFHAYLDTVPLLKYHSLDPKGSYTVKLFAQRESPLQIDGQLAKKIRTGDQFDQVTEQEFEVPASAVEDGKLELSWAPLDEKHLNWRQRHYVTDLWILRHE